MDKTNEQTITVKQLREMLFHIDNQEMTIKELRRRLYSVDNQDAELVVSFSMWRELGVE